MSAVRGSRNKSTELLFAKILRENKITGWRRNLRIYGKPDFVFPKNKIAVFIDGCFWHGCKKHRPLPMTNRKFWSHKIAGNTKRDIKVGFFYKAKGWTVIRIWEHSLREPSEEIKNLQKLVNYNI